MKKKLLCLLFVLCFSHCQAIDSNWVDHWKDALESFSSENYPLACQQYTAAIDQLIAKNDLTYPELYVDRGIAFQMMKQYDEAISDFNTALASEFLLLKETSRAILYRMVAYVSLNMKEETLADLNLLKSTCHDFPVLENTSDTIIIRNLPHSSICIKAIQYLFIHMGVCSSADDFKFYDNTCVITKTCSCVAKKSFTLPPLPSLPSAPNDPNGCNLICGGPAMIALSLSPLLISYPAAMMIYTILVGILQDVCMWCCVGNGFYSNCIEPFKINIIDPFIYYVHLFGEKIGKELMKDLAEIEKELAKIKSQINAPKKEGLVY
jgi:tetratricopeptide (TPR) repeat protein